jgi:hypothetical protein
MNFDPKDFIVSQREVDEMVKRYQDILGVPGSGNVLSNTVAFPIQLIKELYENYKDSEATLLIVGFGITPQDGLLKEERLTVFFEPAKEDPNDSNKFISLAGKNGMNMYNKGFTCPPRFCRNTNR